MSGWRWVMRVGFESKIRHSTLAEIRSFLLSVPSWLGIVPVRKFIMDSRWFLMAFNEILRVN